MRRIDEGPPRPPMDADEERTFAAFRAVVDVLNPLDHEERRRVLRAAALLLMVDRLAGHPEKKPVSDYEARIEKLEVGLIAAMQELEKYAPVAADRARLALELDPTEEEP